MDEDGKQVFFGQALHLEPYSAAWPARFEEEKARLVAVLGADVRIEHFGSTSIPGIAWAKPIIDITAELGAGMPPSDALKDALRALGYLSHATPEIPEDRYARFNKGRPVVDTCLHLVHSLADSNALRMRDYMRAHPEAAARYAAVKYDIWQSFHSPDAQSAGSMMEYRTRKTPVLTEISQLAKEWHDNGRPI